jgi:geranylgeranyl pyrophosphate synthase
VTVELGTVLAEVSRYARASLPAAWPEVSRLLGPALAEPAAEHCAIPLAAARAVGGELRDAVPFAAAWLLIGMSVRILDDIGDADNPSSIDREIGAAAAMNLGGGLLVHASCLLGRLPGAPERVACLRDGYHEMAMRTFAAQGRDLTGVPLAFDTYRRVVEEKTAVPFGFAAWGSAVLHTDDPATLTACRDAGFHAGVMLQLLDDLEACWFPDGPSDLAIGKITYPIYMGIHQPGPLAAELAGLVQRPDVWHYEDRIVELLDELGIRDRIVWAAIRERDAALAALGRCPDPAGREILRAYVDWTFRDVDELRRRTRRRVVAA